MGSVSPLIAIHQQLKSTHYSLRIIHYESFWLGTKNGPEREVVEKAGITFQIISAGKLRRYFDLRNIADVFKIKLGFFQALSIIKKFKPDIILTAGSFVAVPVAFAGWFLKVPVIVHQQDVRVGLANKLMAKIATRITVALDISLKDFPKSKTVLVGNPVRQFPVSDIRFPISFNNNLPVLLVIGGGTGALALNNIIWESLPELTNFCNIIHITGKNKNQFIKLSDYQIIEERYKQVEFLDEDIFSTMAQADLVISRAGMSALTELAYFKKPCLIVPIPNSHQEENVAYFAAQGAGIYLKQNELDKVRLVREVKNLLDNRDKRYELGDKMNKIFCDYSGETFVGVILSEARFDREARRAKNLVKN